MVASLAHSGVTPMNSDAADPPRSPPPAVGPRSAQAAQPNLPAQAAQAAQPTRATRATQPAALRVGVLSVGDELLAGDIPDTNAHRLARELAARGHQLVSVATVGDQVDAVRRAIERAAEDCDLLLVSGGLGPTRDDLTREGVAAAFGLPLEERGEYLHQAQGRQPVLTDDARLQAHFPRGARVLENAQGTAPGFLVEGRPAGRAAQAPPLRVACFPGVPSELLPMALALFATLPQGPAPPARSLRCCGLTEAALGDALKDLMRRDRAGCRVGVTAAHGVHTVCLRGGDAQDVAQTEAEIRRRLGTTVFGAGDTSLAEAVVEMLAARRLVVGTAESCTGGLLAGAITSVSGASAVFRQGVVTYSDECKQRLLEVPAELLARHGAVSEPVAVAMATGLRRRSACDVALSITGIAGPLGGSSHKPVGSVVLALADAAGERVVSHVWRGSRDDVRQRAVTRALELLRRRLLGEG